MFNFDNTYINLNPNFYQKTQADTPLNPKLIAFNHELADELGIDFKDSKELLSYLSGAKTPSNTTSISLAYAGHQFGHLNPNLGDGRALLLGEIIAKNGERYDLQLKGSGRTKYSRRGDGKSPLGPVLREYIMSEAMHALGVPTTRALAAIKTDEIIHRQQSEPGGIFSRVAKSHIRIGTFVYFALKDDKADLKILADYTIKRHYQDVAELEDPYFEFFKAVSFNQVKLVSTWMSLGFIHGVMNTDNTTISGQTIDYGPCAFMDYFNYNQVYSSIDQNARYSYQNQGNIIIWNLARFGESLIPLMGDDENKTIKKLTEFLENLAQIFKSTLDADMTAKLGLRPSEKSLNLLNTFLMFIQNEKLDFTNSFRNLNLLLLNKDHDYAPTEHFKHFFSEFKKAHTNSNTESVVKSMNKVNPVYIPRNHQVHKAIKDGIKGDFKHFHLLNEVLKNPFNEQAGKNDFLAPPKEGEVVHQTFCGT